MSDRWAAFIDIEGFSELWDKEDGVLWALGELMRGIHRIGSRVYTESPDRLFAHQFGDGFLLISDFHEDNLDRCTAICVSIMRHVASYGYFTRCCVSEGAISDIQGCYPREVMKNRIGESDTVSMNGGLMTFTPVMGTALIKSYGLGKKCPAGPLLIMPKDFEGRFSKDYPRKENDDGSIIILNWTEMDSQDISEIQRRAKLVKCENIEIKNKLRCYITKNNVPDSWRKSVNQYLNVD